MKARNDLAAQVHAAEDKAAKLEAQGTEVENNLNAILTEFERLEPKRLHLRYRSPCPLVYTVIHLSSCSFFCWSCMLHVINIVLVFC